MKKIYLLFLCFISVSFAQSQTLLNEEFEGDSFPPPGWALLNAGTSTDYKWALNSDSTLGYVIKYGKAYPSFIGQGSMVYESDPTAAANAWAITPSLNLSAGTSYTLTFYYIVYKSQNPEKLKITVGSSPTPGAQSSVLWDNDGGTELANDSAWTKATIKYTPNASGNYYFGFNCYSNANEYALMVDNIKVEVTPTAVPPCAVIAGPADGATNVTAPQALFTWDSASTASEYVFKLGTTNTPDSIGFSTGKASYQSDLLYGTTYYWTVVPKNTAGLAEGCPVYSFTTQVAPPKPVNDDCSGAVEISSGSTVTASTRSATQSLPAMSCNGSAGDANDDVWFKFTATQETATITLKPDLIFDGVINAYSGTCGSLDSLACADQGFDGETETLTLSNLTAGNTYYFRVYGYGDAGKDGSFTLTLSGTTLPVNITDFKGEKNGPQNLLSWTTLTEQNNKGFELQRSANGRDFATLTFIASKAVNGNSTIPLIYRFSDPKPSDGNVYYRLKQVDIDGRYTTSNIVVLKGLISSGFALSNIYPNPAKSVVNVVVTAPVTAAVNITITDLACRPVMRQVMQLAVGENNLSINLSRLPSGTYLLKAVFATSGQTVVSKVIKQ